MDIKQLTTFVTLAKEKNYIKASFKLNYAPSTLTEHVHSLEKELDVKLVERGRKTICLTAEGKLFLSYAKQFLDLYEETRVSLHRDGIRGALRVGVAESIGQYSLVSLFHDFALQYPDVELSVRVGNCADFADWIQEETIDVGFAYGTTSLENEVLEATPLFEEPLFFTVHPLHRLAQMEAVYPADLSGENLALTYQNCCYSMALKRLLEKEQVELKSQLHLGSVTMIRGYIKEKFGVALLPLAAIEEDLKRGEIKVLPWKGPVISIIAQMIYSKNRPLTLPMEALVKEAKQQADRREEQIASFIKVITSVNCVA